MRPTQLLGMVICFCLWCSGEAICQCYENPPGSKNFRRASGGPCADGIPTVVPFLRITPDARSGGMGDAGIAISPDANSMHLNASKLAFAYNDFALSASYSPLLGSLGLKDVYMAYLAGYKRIDDHQTLGFSLRYISLGDIQFTNTNRQPIGFGRPKDFEISLGFARKLGENFSVGVNGKIIYSNLGVGQMLGGIEINPGIAGAADISFHQRFPMRYSTLTLGLTLSNLGSRISYTQMSKHYLPSNFGLGSAWQFFINDKNSLTIVADVNKLMVPTPQHNLTEEKSVFNAIIGSWSDAPGGFNEELKEFTYSLGSEYWYNRKFALRTGYFHESILKGAREYITLGLGLKIKVLGINISYLISTTPTLQSSNPLNRGLRFSLLFDFNKVTKGVDVPSN